MNIQGISPTIAAPMMGQTASNPNAAASQTNSSSGTSSLSSSSLESTFMNLLVTELQNQDPTQPVDPTEMVSQMVSLNQLDQLISINQTLQNLTSGSTASSSATGTSQAGYAVTAKATGASPLNTPVPTASLPQAPAAYPGTASNSGLMNLYGSFGLPAASTNSIYAGVR